MQTFDNGEPSLLRSLSLCQNGGSDSAKKADEHSALPIPFMRAAQEAHVRQRSDSCSKAGAEKVFHLIL
jgi:hypothetical protein